MIRCIGWFSTFEPDGPGTQEYYNIVLELAELDFYEAIQKQSPPISFEEIQCFWESMSEISATLASIHTVAIEGHNYSTWHGDIKPENILLVDDRFKLADPGEASMQLQAPGPSCLPPSKLVGGTRTYAAPEKAAYLDGMTNKIPNITQKSDVWSLGCVLSIAATYVVLGTQGFLIYNQLRCQAFHKATGSISDVFHDGERVLPEVSHWHRYLREAVRNTDTLSATVLDMVDNHMLVAKEKRWNAKQVHEKLREILGQNEVITTRVPRELQDLLQNIDLKVERDYNHHSGFRKVEHVDATNRLVSISLPPAEVEFNSRQRLLEQAIQPTAQRSQKTGGSPVQSPRPSLTVTTTNYHTPQAQKSDQRNESLSPSSHPVQAPQSSITKLSSQLPPVETQRRKPTKVGQVKQELRKYGLTYKPSITSLSSIINKQKTTVLGRPTGDQDLEKLDIRLQKEFKDRDIVFLVDNGATMLTWWTQATELLEVLVWRVLGYDDNGMELYFTDPDTNPKAFIKESPKQTVKQFTRAMNLAEPSEKGPPCQTSILPELERIVNTYTRAKISKTPPRRKTIIVLTDGTWPGMHDEYTLDLYFRSAFHHFRDLHGDLTYVQRDKSHDRQDISEIKPVTIQFVQFGDDHKATERLRRLDDDLKYLGCPDLIDTEHAEGDIYKMFLGSLCRDIDHVMRYSLGPAISPTPTIQNAAGEQEYIQRLSVQNNNYVPSPAESIPHQGFQAVSYEDGSLSHHPRSTPSYPAHELPAAPQEDQRDTVSPLSRGSTQRAARPQASEVREATTSAWPAPLQTRGPQNLPQEYEYQSRRYQ